MVLRLVGIVFADDTAIFMGGTSIDRVRMWAALSPKPVSIPKKYFH